MDTFSFELIRNGFLANLEGVIFFLAIVFMVGLLHRSLKAYEFREVPVKKKPGKK